MSDALAADEPLNHGLVRPIDSNPIKCCSEGDGPKRVSPQRVYVKAGVTK